MRSKKPLAIAVLLVVITATIFLTRYGPEPTGHLKGALDAIRPTPNLEVPGGCEENLAWLEPYHLTYPIDYVSRDIVARPRPDAQRPSLTMVEKPLFGDYSTFDLVTSQTVKPEKCQAPLELEVPHGSMMPVDASNLIFGMQTTLWRLRETVQHLARWLPHTGARLYVIVKESEDVKAPADQMAALEKEMRALGMNVSIINPVNKNDPFAWRYFSLVHVMYAARDHNTQWTITIDDDTFFPSMWDLQNELKKYDHTKPQYVGSLSEDWWAVNHYGLMGFGGAGIYLSLPMAQIFETHPECKTDIHTSAGDIAVMDCVYRFTSYKLISVPTMHQVDMHGDLSGFYESGRPIISLHHWKPGSPAEYPLEMHKLHLVADICDSCFLQRYQFPNDMLLSNGFSITTYPQGHLRGKNGGVLGTGIAAGKLENKVGKIDLANMEETWNDQINVQHSLCPCRERMTWEQKVSYRLLDSMVVEGGNKEKIVRQIYHREGQEIEKEAKDGTKVKERERDTVMVLNWRSGAQKSEEGR